MHRGGQLQLLNCIVVAPEQAGVICHGAGLLCLFVLLLLGGLLSRDRVFVAAGTLVRAAHCILEKIGRSGCEAENGGVRNIPPATAFQQAL